jgi:hypothetical protein
MNIDSAVEVVNAITESARGDALMELANDNAKLIAMVIVEKCDKEAINMILQQCSKEFCVSLTKEDCANRTLRNLLGLYERSVDPDCRLTSSARPPNKPYLLVQAMCEAGTVLCPSGPVNITKGSIMNVIPEDVDFLLQSGILVKLD